MRAWAPSKAGATPGGGGAVASKTATAVLTAVLMAFLRSLSSCSVLFFSAFRYLVSTHFYHLTELESTVIFFALSYIAPNLVDTIS